MRSPPSRTEEAFPKNALADPNDLAIGDRFEKCGRIVIKWQVDAITRLPHVGKIVTLAEVEGTARIQVFAPDLFIMGFHPTDKHTSSITTP
ncbi:hypothetical protein [Telmatospirillum siberiense]|uniref:hypothetical protein n=1 Tax=Telmatospirillum siberiense TaxID=382514 RepID=UPI0011AF8A36|nr:hypothetical protein [Telmatospirillum siberiense]